MELPLGSGGAAERGFQDGSGGPHLPSTFTARGCPPLAVRKLQHVVVREGCAGPIHSLNLGKELLLPPSPVSSALCTSQPALAVEDRQAAARWGPAAAPARAAGAAPGRLGRHDRGLSYKFQGHGQWI